MTPIRFLQVVLFYMYGTTVLLVIHWRKFERGSNKMFAPFFWRVSLNSNPLNQSINGYTNKT
jgi:hypothetical protein